MNYNNCDSTGEKGEQMYQWGYVTAAGFPQVEES